MSKEAKRLLKIGFKGNGCGSDKVSKILCSVAMLPFDLALKRDLQDCWSIHDAEYTITTALKSDIHKAHADDWLKSNMECVFKQHNISTNYSKRFVTVVHYSLLFGGNKAYWGKKANSNWHLTPNAIVTTSIILIAKYFGVL